MRLATVSEVPTPWLCLQEDLRRAGIAPDRLSRKTDGTMADNCTALQRGVLDAVQVFEPYASMLLAEGSGHIWYAAANRGPTSYTTFYARRGLLTARRAELSRMVRAIAKTQRWVSQASGAQIASEIAPYFPDVPATTLETSCERYLALGIWSRSPVMPRTGYDRLLSSLVSGGFVSTGTPFEVAVDNSLAEAAEAAITRLAP